VIVLMAESRKRRVPSARSTRSAPRPSCISAPLC
jgi:hypothetical protein